jgi:RNA polymerase sigma factor (sigma-70 family)
VSAPLPSNSSPVTDHSRWFKEEVHAHDSSLRSYLHGTFPAVRDVDDVVQESYLRLWRARPTQPIVCARAFLFRVARNVALSLLRRERAAPIISVKDFTVLPVVDDGRSAASAACLEEELLLLAQAIDSLPARCREIVILRRIERLSHKEIAERLGIAVETVEVQVARGVKRCASYLRRHGATFEHETRP